MESPAQDERVKAALRDVMSLLDSGFLVRNTKNDYESDWAIEALPSLRTLANAAAVLQECCNEKRMAMDSQEAADVLQRCLSFLADLNGSNWIAGDDVGSVDMRQRAKALQRLAFAALSQPSEITKP